MAQQADWRKADSGGCDDDAEEFEIDDARTGKPLWAFNLGQPMHASPMPYGIEGKQYFAVAAGDDVFAFALP